MPYCSGREAQSEAYKKNAVRVAKREEVCFCARVIEAKGHLRQGGVTELDRGVPCTPLRRTGLIERREGQARGRDLLQVAAIEVGNANRARYTRVP